MGICRVLGLGAQIITDTREASGQEKGTWHGHRGVYSGYRITPVGRE